MNDQHTLPTITLDDERTDQLRTFLTVEAAADLAAGTGARRASVRSDWRRLALGALAAVLLGGALLASTTIVGSPGASRADAVAIEEAAGWINIRIVDVDADPEAVVDELRAAGIDAEVSDPAEAGMVAAGPGAGAAASGSTGLSVETPDGNGAGMVSVGPDAAPPLEVDPGIDPEDPSITAPAVTTVDAVEATGEVTGSTGAIGEGDVTTEGDPALPPPDIDTDLAASGVRFEADGSISIRAGAEVTVLVFAA